MNIYLNKTERQRSTSHLFTINRQGSYWVTIAIPMGYLRLLFYWSYLLRSGWWVGKIY